MVWLGFYFLPWSKIIKQLEQPTCLEKIKEKSLGTWEHYGAWVAATIVIKPGLDWQVNLEAEPVRVC